jgi:branched-chain amino acid transport system substrate-binding protein
MEKIYKYNKIKTAILFLFIFLAAIIISCPAKDLIKIGVILPFSGAESIFSNEIKNSLLLAEKDINASGGISGNKIKFIFEDNKSDIKESGLAFNRIELNHHPLFYITTHSAFSMSLAPYAEKNKVPLFSLISTSSDITKNRTWVFRYYFNPQEEANSAKIVIEELKIRHLGVLYNDNEGSASILQEVKKGLMGKSIEKSMKIIPFQTNRSDFNDEIKKLSDTDALYFIGTPLHLKNFLHQIKSSGYKGTILTIASGAEPEIRNLKESDNIYVSASSFYHPNIKFDNKLKENYKSKYNMEITHRGASAYDLIKLISSLLSGKKISRESMRTVLDDGFVYPGILGVISINKGNHDISFPLFPAQIVNQELKFLEINK